MKQAKAIALIGLAASMILFAHYADADEGRNDAVRAGNQGLVTLGPVTQQGQVYIGNPPATGRVAPGQIPRVQPHLVTHGRTTLGGVGELDECGLRAQVSNLVTRFLIGQLPRQSCN